MKKIYFFFSIVCMLLITSCTKEKDNNVNAVDQDFMSQLALSIKAEIATAQLVSTKTTNPSVKTYVQELIAEYGAAQEELHQLAASLNVDLASVQAEEQVSMILRLDGLSGESFDSTYMFGAVQSQQKILNLFQKAFNEGNNANVKGYVHRYIDLVEKHFLSADRIARSL
jgi:putative membrane protein